MKVPILFAFLAVFSCQVRAQMARDIIHVNYTFLPKATLPDGKGEFTQEYLDLFGTLKPIPIGRRVELIQSFYYRYTHLAYDDAFLQQGPFPARLHDFRYLATLRMPLATNWNLLLLPRIEIRGELDRPLNINDLIPLTGLLVSHTVSGDRNFKIGLGGLVGLFDYRHVRFWPLLQLYYDKPKVRMEIALPYANFCYKLNKDLEVGIFSMVDNNVIATVTPFVFENELATRIHISQLAIAPTLNCRLYRNLYGHVKFGGLVPLRRLRPLNEDLKPIDELRFNPGSSLYFKLGFSLRRSGQGS